MAVKTRRHTKESPGGCHASCSAKLCSISATQAKARSRISASRIGNPPPTRPSTDAVWFCADRSPLQSKDGKPIQSASQAAAFTGKREWVECNINALIRLHRTDMAGACCKSRRSREIPQTAKRCSTSLRTKPSTNAAALHTNREAGQADKNRRPQKRITASFKDSTGLKLPKVMCPDASAGGLPVEASVPRAAPTGKPKRHSQDGFRHKMALSSRGKPLNLPIITSMVAKPWP